MKRLAKRLGSILLYSRGHENIRGSVVFLFTQSILVLTLVLIAECLIILLGINNIFLPFTLPLNLILEKILY